jgi:hypothetical protein
MVWDYLGQFGVIWFFWDKKAWEEGGGINAIDELHSAAFHECLEQGRLEQRWNQRRSQYGMVLLQRQCAGGNGFLSATGEMTRNVDCGLHLSHFLAIAGARWTAFGSLRIKGDSFERKCLAIRL